VFRNLYLLPLIRKDIMVLSAVTVMVLASISAPANAVESPVNRKQSLAAQQKTVYALQAIKQNQWDIGEAGIAAARDPLASKLYYWLVFAKKKDVPNYTRLTQFIRSNPQWPNMGALRRKAEEQMPASARASEVIAWFNDYPPKTGQGIERYVDALKAAGQGAKARQILSDWWASNTLSRDQQRKLFAKFKGDLSLTAHKRRFDNLLYKGHYDNARAIASELGAGYPELAEARIALAQERKNVNALIAKVPKNLQGDAGLLYERLRWRRRNDMDVGAMEILHQMPPASEIQNLDKWWRERHIIIRRLIEKKHWKSAYLLASQHQQKSGLPFAQGEWLAGWLALRFMDNPVGAYQHFDTLYRGVKSPVSRARAAYWAGRASDGFQDKTVQQRWYKIAAQMQTVFYGQLAAAELGFAQSLPHAAPPTINAQEKQYFDARELVQAASLFARAGMQKEAGTFLNAFVNSQDTAKSYYYAANLAVEKGLLKDAVRISKRATRKGMFLTAQSYPVISERLRSIDLEWALIHGIIRQESMFDAKANSPAGALGLMQLMPPTAREVAGKMGKPYSKSQLTLNPNYNIALGSYYLDELVNRFDGAYPLAIASYNAGPGRVGRWLDTFGDPRDGDVDLLDWIEMIPVYETRNYVQRVLEATYVYRLRLRSVQPMPKTPLHVAMINRK
jgi:soluble lytic murein transglycosylase